MNNRTCRESLVMDKELARKISKINEDFYAHVAPSFDSTRQGAWAGWQKALELVDTSCLDSMSVLDLACGNLRFERYLAEHGFFVGPVLAVDISEELVELGMAELRGISAKNISRLSFHRLNLVQALEEGELGRRLCDMASSLPECSDGFSLSCCFGFMHHLPLEEQRRDLLRILCEMSCRGGYLIASFWAFAQDDGLRKKAMASTKEACALYEIDGLGPDDYFLGWQNEQQLYRYCHSFSKEELDALLESLGNRVELRARFLADGRNGRLNHYLVLRVS